MPRRQCCKPQYQQDGRRERNRRRDHRAPGEKTESSKKDPASVSQTISAEADFAHTDRYRLGLLHRNPIHRCKQCRQAKIKCSGSIPCARCARRRDTCVFPSDEPHVSVPERYLKDLERRVARARLSQTSARNVGGLTGPSASSPPNAPNATQQEQEHNDGYGVIEAPNAQPENSRHGSRSLDALGRCG